MDFAQIALLYGVLLVSLVVHEAAHALFALLGGDKTAYLGGQVTLNPVPHIQREPFGTVILPLGMLLLSNGNMTFGFAHAPYDPHWAERHPKRAALMSAAGPMANVLLAVIAFVVLKTMLVTGVAEPYGGGGALMWLEPADGSTSGATVAAIKMASTFTFLNVILAILNLIPIAPFDGAGVVEGLFPRTRRFYSLVRSQPLFLIIGLVAIWQLLPELYIPVLKWITAFLR